jgi:acetylornithine deacetylase/succinyl-diaminopimelate desuccinylase-like protein
MTARTPGSPYPVHPVELLQRLIRFDTTNPPGNEQGCIAYLASLLGEAGLGCQTFARDPERPNLIARLPGRGEAPPLLFYGHVDVVTTAHQCWTVPPFEGRLVDGTVWGRGALDMKGGVAMMVAAVLRAQADGLTPAGDVILAVLSDEEAGGDVGARFLVEAHPEQFAGVRYAIGELGGFALTLRGRRFYPIQVAEKQLCWLRATVRGPGGHAALPLRGGAMAGLARVLDRLDRRRLPVHITPVPRMSLTAMAAHLPFPDGLLLRLLLNPRLTDRVLDLMGPLGRGFGPLLHNTVSPTIVQGGEKINVIPSRISLELDGRLLPGFGPDDVLAELRALLGPAVAFEVLRSEPGPPEPDMGLFEALAGILNDADPTARALPLLLPAVTDARHFARLGIQTYGFLPMRLPPDFDFLTMIHAADERVPAEAVVFGTAAITELLRRYGR